MYQAHDVGSYQHSAGKSGFQMSAAAASAPTAPSEALFGQSFVADSSPFADPADSSFGNSSLYQHQQHQYHQYSGSYQQHSQHPQQHQQQQSTFQPASYTPSRSTSNYTPSAGGGTPHQSSSGSGASSGAAIAPSATPSSRTRSNRANMLGNYILMQTIGEGEFAKVKLAVHKDSNDEVAIKLIRKDNLDTTEKRSKVEREILALRSVNHPNIVRIIDLLETDKYIGIALEYASGGELFDHILAHKYLREKDACRLFAQLMSGVAHLHARNIVHRDLKLENLLLDKNRNVVITDFGFANQFDNPAADLMATSCGSPCYAAPELVLSEGMYVGTAADIWSCGVILYAMLAGYLPYDDDPTNPDSENISQLYQYIISTPLVYPDYVPRGAKLLMQRILVPDPVKRADIREISEHEWLKPHAHLLRDPKLVNGPSSYLNNLPGNQQQQQRRRGNSNAASSGGASALLRKAVDPHGAAAVNMMNQQQYHQHQQNTAIVPSMHSYSAGNSSGSAQFAMPLNGAPSHSAQSFDPYSASSHYSKVKPAEYGAASSLPQHLQQSNRQALIDGDDGSSASLSMVSPATMTTSTVAANQGSANNSASATKRHTIQIEYDAANAAMAMYGIPDLSSMPMPPSSTVDAHLNNNTANSGASNINNVSSQMSSPTASTVSPQQQYQSSQPANNMVTSPTSPISPTSPTAAKTQPERARAMTVGSPPPSATLLVPSVPIPSMPLPTASQLPLPGGHGHANNAQTRPIGQSVSETGRSSGVITMHPLPAEADQAQDKQPPPSSLITRSQTTAASKTTHQQPQQYQQNQSFNPDGASGKGPKFSLPGSVSSNFVMDFFRRKSVALPQSQNMNQQQQHQVHASQRSRNPQQLSGVQLPVVTTDVSQSSVELTDHGHSAAATTKRAAISDAEDHRQAQRNLKVHTGPIDNNALTSLPPRKAFAEVRKHLLDMGLVIIKERDFKVKVMRPVNPQLVHAKKLSKRNSQSKGSSASRDTFRTIDSTTSSTTATLPYHQQRSGGFSLDIVRGRSFINSSSNNNGNNINSSQSSISKPSKLERLNTSRLPTLHEEGQSQQSQQQPGSPSTPSASSGSIFGSARRATLSLINGNNSNTALGGGGAPMSPVSGGSSPGGMKERVVTAPVGMANSAQAKPHPLSVNTTDALGRQSVAAAGSISTLAHVDGITGNDSTVIASASTMASPASIFSRKSVDVRRGDIGMMSPTTANSASGGMGVFRRFFKFSSGNNSSATSPVIPPVPQLNISATMSRNVQSGPHTAHPLMMNRANTHGLDEAISLTTANTAQVTGTGPLAKRASFSHAPSPIMTETSPSKRSQHQSLHFDSAGDTTTEDETDPLLRGTADNGNSVQQLEQQQDAVQSNQFSLYSNDLRQDAGGEVIFVVELHAIKNLPQMYMVALTRRKGNLSSYKYLYDTYLAKLNIRSLGPLLPTTSRPTTAQAESNKNQQKKSTKSGSPSKTPQSPQPQQQQQRQQYQQPIARPITVSGQKPRPVTHYTQSDIPPPAATALPGGSVVTVPAKVAVSHSAAGRASMSH